MVSRAEILVHSSADDVAEALAARLMSRLVELQRDARTPQVALTGGRIATKAYQRLGLEGRSSATGKSSQTRVNCVAARCQWESVGPDQRSALCCASRCGRIGR